jgi:hypothetical protein
MVGEEEFNAKAQRLKVSKTKKTGTAPDFPIPFFRYLSLRVFAPLR